MRVSYAFDTSRTKRVIYAFSIYGVTQTPKERFPEVFPGGFYTAIGVKTSQKYKIFLNHQLPKQYFFKLMHGIRFINDFYHIH